MKILILGSKGMLGHVLSTYFKENYKDWTIDGVARDIDPYFSNIALDLTDFDSLKKILAIDYDVIINAAAILVKDSENQKVNAIKINSELPHFIMENKCQNTKYIHISTNTLFDSLSTKNKYLEVDDEKINVKRFYDKTKYLGEVFYDNHILIRTSIIGFNYNHKKENLLNWFINQKEIDGYSKALWNGTTTLELAKRIAMLIRMKFVGKIHICVEHEVSKYELLAEMNKFLQCPIIIKKSNKDGGATGLLWSDYPEGIIKKSYYEQLEEYINWVLDHKNIYGDKYLRVLKTEGENV